MTGTDIQKCPSKIAAKITAEGPSDTPRTDIFPRISPNAIIAKRVV